jgi:hypothetical protein
LQVMNLMRHAKVTTTFNVFGHLWDDVDERLDAMREDTYAEGSEDKERTGRGVTASQRSRKSRWPAPIGVELRGIEPLTPSMPWKCSTN